MTSLEFENGVVRIFLEYLKMLMKLHLIEDKRKACFYLIRFSIRSLNHPLINSLNPILDGIENGFSLEN